MEPAFRRGDENRPPPPRFPSGTLNGTHPIPAPSLRELSSECETEGVSSDGCFGPMVYSQSHKKALKLLTPYVHRSTLPQLRCAQQLPQRGSREGFHHSSGYSLKSQVSGDFHRPYETLMILVFTIHRTTLPQSRPVGRDSSLKEGAGRAFTIHPGTC